MWMWMMPLHLHFNQKSDYDDGGGGRLSMNIHEGIRPNKPNRMKSVYMNYEGLIDLNIGMTT